MTTELERNLKAYVARERAAAEQALPLLKSATAIVDAWDRIWLADRATAQIQRIRELQQ